MKYIAQALWSRFVDWIIPKWAALKAKAVAALKKLHTRNTGDR